MKRLAEAFQPDEAPSEDTQDLERRFIAQLREYAEQHKVLDSSCKQDMQCGFDAIPTAPAETADVPGMFRKWRSNFIAQVTDLDNRLPKLRLCAERLKNEVEEALTPRNDSQTLRSFLHQRFLRRAGTLKHQIAMLLSRLRLNSRVHSGVLANFGPGIQDSAPPVLEATLALLRQELEACEERAHALHPTVEPAPDIHSVGWAASMFVLVRALVSEETATRAPRSFLKRLQYLGFTHRSRLWRRALDLRAVTEIPDQGDNCDSPPCKAGCVPLGVTSRRQLEHALHDLGQAFGCSISLSMDKGCHKGKAFAHQVAVEFPQIFEAQQRRMEFRVYPLVEDRGSVRDMPSDILSDDLAEGSVDDVQSKASASVGIGDRLSDVESYFLRPSDWAKRAPWRASSETGAQEQGVLLRASFLNGRTPVRMQHGPPSYARQLLTNVVDNATSHADCVAEWEANIDSVLRSERSFLEVGDIKTVVRRLNELAERRPTLAREEESLFPTAPEAEEQQKLPQPLLRAYYMLRHLQCREQRQRLLGLMNFFRFLQRRLVAGSDEALAVQPFAAGGEPPGSGAAGERALQPPEGLLEWGLSPRALSRESEGEHDGGSGGGALDCESLQLTSNGEIEVVNEAGRKIVHAAAVSDLKALENEMLSTGSFFIHQFESATSSSDVERPVVDRIGVLLDLYNSEVWFNLEKRKLMEVYLEIYEHTADPLEKHDLAQRIVDVMVVRPRLDLNDGYFTDAYAVAISVLESRSSLLRMLVRHAVVTERAVAKASQERAAQASSHSSGASPVFLAHVVGQRRDSGVQLNIAQPSASQPGVAGDHPEAVAAASPKGSSDGSERCDGEDSKLEAHARLVHPLEGYRCGECADDTVRVLLAPSAEPVAIDEFCSSASLAWKAELLIEEVHRDMVDNFHPPSALMSTLIERACYTFALEQWRAVEEEEKDNARNSEHGGTMDDPELLMLIVNEIAIRLIGQAVRSEDEDEAQQPSALRAIGGLEVDGFLRHSFSDMRRRCGGDATHLVTHLIANLLEHLELRRELGDTAKEVSCLEKAFLAQSASFGTKPESIRPSALVRQSTVSKAGVTPRTSPGRVNTWIDPSGPVLAAGMLESDMGSIDLQTARGFALQVSPMGVLEMRHLCQHELAYRSLVLTCVQHNSLLLDPNIRQKEIADVALVGPSRELMAGKPFALVTWKLRQTAALSGESGARRVGQQKVKGADTQMFMDLSRHAQHLQVPATHLLPIRDSVAQLAEAKIEALRAKGHGAFEFERQVRMIWHRLLTCCSLCTIRAACDLSIRVQAAHASIGLRAIAALIPSKLSPFDRGSDRKRQLVERDGSVGSVFTIPAVLDVLQLRGMYPDPDIALTMSEIASVLVAGVGSGERRSRRMTFYRRSHASLAEAEDFAMSFFQRLERVVPCLELDYDGPGFTTLSMLHELANLVMVRYSLATVDGDPLTLLRMQRFARFSSLELDVTQDVAGSTLSRTEPTFEALEQLRTDLARLARRLDTLGESAREPSAVLCVLRSEVCGAFRQLLVLLRNAAHECLHSGASGDFVRLRQWTYYLEGIQYGAVGSVPSLVPPGQHVPLASLPIFGQVDVQTQDVELAMRGKPIRVSATGDPIDEPEVTTFHEDGVRYLAKQHPTMPSMCPSLHPFMQVLLCAYIPPPSVENLGERIKIDGDLTSLEHVWWPYRSRIPWQQPRALLLPLISALCMMVVPLRRVVSAERLSLERRRDEFYHLHEILQSHCERSAEADIELFGSLLLCDILKECVACGELTMPRPTTKEALAMFESHIDARFSPVEASTSTSRRLFSGPICSAARTPDTARQEIDQRYRQIAALTTALDHVLVASASERLSLKLAILAQYRHRSVALASAKLAPISITVEHGSSGGGGLYAMKVDAILYALNKLRDRGTYVQMRVGEDDPMERAFVFREHDVNDCVEELMLSLSTWGDDMIRSREGLMNQFVGYLRFRYNALQQELSRLGGAQSLSDSHTSKSAVQRDASIKAQVADQGCRLVFEVDRLHRTIRDLKTVSRELDFRLSNEVWDRVRDAVSTLTARLTAEIGRFREGHGDRADKVAAQMRAIREQVANQLASISAANYAAQERTQRSRPQPGAEVGLDTVHWTALQGRSEEDHDDEQSSVLLAGDGESARLLRHVEGPASAHASILLPNPDDEPPQRLVISDGMYTKFSEVTRHDSAHLLRLEIAELTNTQVLARAFHHLKVQAMRQRFDEKMQALKMTLASNQELWGRLGNASRKERQAEHELSTTAQDTALAELKIEQLHGQVESNTDRRQKLQSWKKNKARQVMHLEQKVRSHQRLGAIDVEGMLQELQEKGELVEQLREDRQEEDEVVEREQRAADKKLALLRRRLQELRRGKEIAAKALARTREEIERGDMSGEERLRLWRYRVSEANARVSELEKENARLQSKSSDLSLGNSSRSGMSEDDGW